MSLSGIHGEPGIQRSKVTVVVMCNSVLFTSISPLVLVPVCIIPHSQVSSADEVVKTMIDHMTNPDSQSHLPLKSGAEQYYIISLGLFLLGFLCLNATSESFLLI